MGGGRRAVTEWTTVDKVRAALGLDAGDVTDDTWLQSVVEGVNTLVDDTRQPVYDADGNPVPPVVDGRTSWGATQLATRWFSRRNSNDITAFVELGGPPPSIDRDVELALQINRYYGPAIA
jgi:hypothetical protein